MPLILFLASKRAALLCFTKFNYIGLKLQLFFCHHQCFSFGFHCRPFFPFSLFHIFCAPRRPCPLCRIYSVNQWSQRMNSLYSLPDFMCYLTSKKNCIFTLNWYCLLKTKVPAEKNVCRRRNISSGNLFLLTFWLCEIRTKWTERVCVHGMCEMMEKQAHMCKTTSKSRITDATNKKRRKIPHKMSGG